MFWTGRPDPARRLSANLYCMTYTTAVCTVKKPLMVDIGTVQTM